MYELLNILYVRDYQRVGVHYVVLMHNVEVKMWFPLRSALILCNAQLLVDYPAYAIAISQQYNKNSL